ncbi:hypothetical protein [Phytohabitans houttuyneae]|nr:hypothetical protein [Phytohabitans houttuyneae]
MALVVDPRGDWVIRQRQPGEGPENDVEVQILVSLSALSPDGTGTFQGGAKWDGRQGELDGSVNGNRIEFTITWPTGMKGEYRGYWYSDGYLRGHTVNVFNPAETAEWWTATNNFRQIQPD